MKRELSYYVPGIPTSQGSKKVFTNKKTGKPILVESAGVKLKRWRNAVKAKSMLAANTIRWEPPTYVGVQIQFYLPRPKSHYGTGRNAGLLKDSAPRLMGSEPDIDKLMRAAFDALTDAGVILDDSKIVDINARKQYADDRGPGAQIWIYDLEELLDEEELANELD